MPTADQVAAMDEMSEEVQRLREFQDIERSRIADQDQKDRVRCYIPRLYRVFAFMKREEK